MTTDTSDPLLVWRVAEGPFCIDDLPYEVQQSYPMDGYDFWVEVMVSYKSDPEYYDYIPMYFETFDEVYRFKTEVDKAMVPLEVDY
jgi:hypothetical protein